MLRRRSQRSHSERIPTEAVLLFLFLVHSFFSSKSLRLQKPQATFCPYSVFVFVPVSPRSMELFLLVSWIFDQASSSLCPSFYRLVGLVEGVRLESGRPGLNPRLPLGVLSGSSHTRDLKCGTPLGHFNKRLALKDHHWAGWPDVSILCLDKIATFNSLWQQVQTSEQIRS